jgi:cobalt-zinc-cadmium efflux system membrane fusion protein
MLIGKDLSGDHSAEVHCHFDQYDKSLIPGMFMNAEIEVKSDSSYALPDEAVVHFENKDYVFMVRSKDQFEMLEIKTGNNENGYTELLLNDPELFVNRSFVTRGAYSLLMKMKNTAEE